MKWKPYPTYRASENRWVGKLPSHWAERKLKQISVVSPSNVDKDSVDSEESVRLCNYQNVYKNEYIVPAMDFMQATASPAEIDKFKVREGDVLVTKDSEEWSDIAVPAYITSDMDNILCGYHLAQVRPNPSLADGEYLFRAFSAGGVNHQFRVAATGITRYGIDKYSLDNSLFPVPPIEEQQSIAAFLRTQTQCIDNLIAKKQRQIELLQEKRSALISHVVTKGLDPNVKMKDSGVEWLRKIPEHWEIVEVKRKYELQLGKMLQNGPDSTADVPVPYIKAMHIHLGHVDVSDLPTMWASPEEIRQYAIKDGDLLVCEGGDAGRAGVVHSPPNACIIQNAAHRVRGNGGDIRFLQYLLHEVSRAGWFDVLCNKATLAHFTGDKFAELRIPIPKALDEQHTIAGFLDCETTRIDSLIGKINEAIEKIREYRTALISAAVTGKIDVSQEVT